MFNFGLRCGRINTDKEILNNTYAVAYDSINNISVGTGKPTTQDIRLINAQFTELKRIARKHSPGKLKYILELERLTAQRIAGTISEKQYLNSIRTIARRHTDNNTLNQIEYNIIRLENQPRQKPFMPKIQKVKTKMPKITIPKINIFGGQKPARPPQQPQRPTKNKPFIPKVQKIKPFMPKITIPKINIFGGQKKQNRGRK